MVLKPLLLMPLVVVAALAASGWLLWAKREAVADRATGACSLACSLAPGQLDRRRERLAAFRDAATAIDPRDDGYALQFRFDEPVYREAVELIALESGCCSFLEFRLTVQPAVQRMALEITGPRGTREFLAGILETGER